MIKKLWFIPAALILAGGIAVAASKSPPANLDYSLSHPSDRGLYQVTLAPRPSPIPVGRMHAWTVAVQEVDGDPTDASLVFDGGMPQHGHGLPTVPKVTGRDSEGRYVVEGVRFNMPGWWRLQVRINGTAGPDIATFNLSL